MKQWAVGKFALLVGVVALAACQSDLAVDFNRLSSAETSDTTPTEGTGMPDAEEPVVPPDPPGTKPQTACDGGVDCEADDPCVAGSDGCRCGSEAGDGADGGSSDCADQCPDDPLKTEAGACGCGEPDVDSDEDGVFDCNDECPTDPDKSERGVCGCGEPEEDSDADGVLDCEDECPNDPDKTAAGVCGCDVPETDEDGDEVPDCVDGCVEEGAQTDSMLCGCAATNSDTDEDGTADCADGCVEDPDKTVPGLCGCGQPEADSDGDGTCDADDGCPSDPVKTAPGLCGCGQLDEDTDADGTCNHEDECPDDANKVEPELCGCGNAELDTDGDGTCDPDDDCPTDPDKSAPQACGCGEPESDDTDGDDTLDCVDGCVDDPLKQAAGACGCGNPDTLGSNDVAECENLANNLRHRYQFNGSGTTVTDSYGTAHGTLIGGTLPNDGSAALSAGVYVDLPNSVISGLSDVTIEAWFTRTAAGMWTRLFDFGSNDGAGFGTSSLFYTVEIGTESRVGFRPLGGNEITQTVGALAPMNTMAHVAVVADSVANEILVYKDGTAAGTMSWTGALSNIDAVNNWIGHSQYSGDPDFVGRIHEFRIYSTALDESAVQVSFDAGLSPSFL